MGLGHTRRNQLIAQTLVASGLPIDVLLLRGMNEGHVPLPNGVDSVTLPALRKAADGSYGSRSLGLSLDDLLKIRSQTLYAAITSYAPDVLIVDNVPLGAQGELERTLAHLRSVGHTQCVLGLRDVLDDPATVRTEWQRVGNQAAIRRYYDSVWVYGDQRVYDPIQEYDFAKDIATKVHFTGYFDQRVRLHYAPSATPFFQHVPFVLCMVGGGQDGIHVAEAFVQADFAGRHGVLVTGPFMPEAARIHIETLAAMRSDVHLLPYATEPTQLLAQAERVIAMGGYNSVSEILAFEKRALIVPRGQPRREQLIRAERLARLNLLTMLQSSELTPTALSRWLAREVPPPQVYCQIDLGGLDRLPALLHTLLDRNPAIVIPQRMAQEGVCSYGTR
jgi:predicted glycosyltransferase